MYENYDGAHLLARRVAMAVSGWPLLTRKRILTQYLIKSNISDSFFLKVSNQDNDVQYDSVSNWWLEESFPLCQSFISRVSLKMNGAAVLLSMCGICGSFSIQDRFWGISNSIDVLEASPLCFVPMVLTFVLPSLKFWSHHQSMNMTVRHWSSLAVCFAKYSNFVLTD